MPRHWLAAFQKTANSNFLLLTFEELFLQLPLKRFQDKKIRVNAVAPGTIWTPPIVSSFEREKVAKLGSDVAMKKPGEPAEVAPCYLFLASDDASYMTGQVLHPNGGEIVNG